MARKNRVVHICQESPFLNLPGEIREQIYYIALVRLTPIDLWPIIFEEDEDTGRIFRIQKDLEFVRKEMATGLTATCKQIYNEAGNVFWSKNTFRFSGDVFWFGARRFLGTIGPRALAQLQSLELFVPLKRTDWEGYSQNNSRLRGRRGYGRQNMLHWIDINAKNRPKMHMVKARAEPWTRDYSRRRTWRWNWTNTSYNEGSKSMLTTNVEHVCHLLATATTELDLKFIISREFGVSIPQAPPHNTTFWLSSNRWDPNIDLKLPGNLARTIELFTKSATLVVEAGAALSVELVPHLTSNNLDVLCEAGATLIQQVPQTMETIEEAKFWKNVATEYYNLIGLPELFEEQQRSEVPALGGRTNKNPGPNRTLRILRGFGGCRFHDRDQWSCAYPWRGWKCKYRGTPRKGYYKHDPKNPHCTLYKEIVIKKKARAAKRDFGNVVEDVQL